MFNMSTGCRKARAWRLRLRAGALALLFAALSALPWLHVLTETGHADHVCRAPAGQTAPLGHTPVVTGVEAAAGDACWVCQSMLVLLQHSAASRVTLDLCAAETAAFVAHAPQAPVFLFINPATRSQAPPALS